MTHGMDHDQLKAIDAGACIELACPCCANLCNNHDASCYPDYPYSRRPCIQELAKPKKYCAIHHAGFYGECTQCLLSPQPGPLP